MARQRHYYQDYAPRQLPYVDPYYDNYEYNKRLAVSQQQPSQPHVMVVQKDAHPEMRLVLAAVLAFTVSPAVGGLYFAMSAANTIVNAIDHTVQQRRAYEHSQGHGHRHHDPAQVPGRAVGTKVLSMVPTERAEQSAGRREGREIEEVVRTLEKAQRNGETHVGIPLRKLEKTMENATPSLSSDKPVADKLARIEQAPYSEWLVIRPIERLMADVKKEAEAGSPFPGKVPMDEKVIQGIVQEEKTTVRQAVEQQIENQNAALKEMVVKWQDAADRKLLTAAESAPSMFGGKVTIEDAVAIRQYLEAEKNDGNRFVTYPSSVESLQVTHFTVHKDAFVAMDHQYEQSKLNVRVEMRSIELVTKELDRLSAPVKDRQQEKVMESPLEKKRYKSMELEC